MIVDCMTCPVRGQRCEDCVVTALLTPVASELPLDAAERRAVSMFVGAGLVNAGTTTVLTARREPLELVRHWGAAGAAGAVG